MSSKGNLKEIASVFLKLGFFAFGGPAAHVAMMEEEVVEKRKWMSRQHFLDTMGATNLIPGPNSTEMTMHCGYERGGSAGLFVAGICFIFPAVLITGFLAWLYVEYGQLPNIEPFIFGIKPAVLAVILGAVIKLEKKALKGLEFYILGILVAAAALYGFNEVYVLLIGGLTGALYFYFSRENKGSLKSFSPLLALPLLSLTKLPALKIFLSFLKVGAILYGSGYVLFAYLDAELVSTGILTRLELLDAIAVGQFTPGPVLSTSTFIGYQLGGFQGAIMATLGIFLPSFLFVWLLNPLIPKMRKSKFLSAFLDSVNVAAVAIMAAVLIDMSKDTLVNWQSISICVLALFAAFLIKKVSSIWIIVGGALLGFLLMKFA